MLIRVLRAEGASPLVLAAAFGVGVSTVYKVLKEQIWAGRQCAGCWRALRPEEHHGGRCARCRAQFCNHCGLPKGAGRKSPRCAACDRENFRGVVARHDTCRECHEPLPETRRDRLCAACRDEYQAFQRQYRDNRGKKCRECGEPVPLSKSWSRNLCRECANQHDRLRRALARRQCGICGRPLGDEKGGLCGPCRSTDRQIRQRGTATSVREIEQLAKARERRGQDP